jgi:HEAT repeat protein
MVTHNHHRVHFLAPHEKWCLTKPRRCGYFLANHGDRFGFHRYAAGWNNEVPHRRIPSVSCASLTDSGAVMLVYFRCRRCRTAQSADVRQSGSPMVCGICKGEMLVPSASEIAPFAVTATPPTVALLPTAIASPAPTRSSNIADSRLLAPFESVARSARRLAMDRTAQMALATVFVVVVAVTGIVGAKLAQPDKNRAQANADESLQAQSEEEDSSMPPLVWERFPGTEEEEEGAGVSPAKGSGKESPTAEQVRQALQIPEKPAWPAIPREENKQDKPRATTVAELAVTHRRDLSEADLRKQLLWSPEVGLTPEQIPDVIYGFKHQIESCDTMNVERNFGPMSLLDASKVARQLPARRRQEWQIDKHSADDMSLMARKLRVYLFEAAPRDKEGHRPSSLVLLRTAMEGEKRGERPEWLRADAVPVLMQMLMHEDASLRTMLVELLSEIPGKASTDALAHRALFDLDQTIRDKAVAALRGRPLEDVRPVLFRGLRYPWAPVADHAAEALVALKDVEAAPELVCLLSEPDPAAPINGRKEQKAVREVVRVHHLSQCLLCHPPSITYADPCPGVVPALTWNYPVADQSTAAVLQSSVSQTTSTIFGAAASSAGCHKYAVDPNVVTITVPPPVTNPRTGARTGISTTSQVRIQTRPQTTTQTQTVSRTKLSTVRLPVLVRGDITYFKQDFSVTQPISQPGNPAPFNARFDFLVRMRTLTPQEVAKLPPPSPGESSYPQRESVLFALRELSGKDVGAKTEAWQELYPTAKGEHKAKELGEALLAGADKKWAPLLEEYKRAKGVVYTEALAYAIPKMEGKHKEKAREALTERLTRMTVATLADKLESDNAEIRTAAIEASVRKDRKSLVPNLIALLQEEDATPNALKALQQLTGQKLVNREEWKEWWLDQGAE